MKLYSPKTISEIKNKYGFRLSKSLGQNFLTDKNIIDKIIVATDITDEDLVIEIGPGIGVITSEAASLAKEVVAIELDKNLIPILNDTLSEHDNVSIINQDVLKTDINTIIEEHPCNKVKIIGNLPYYITTPIIMYLLENHVKADSITIMMQKEVAQRLSASPSSKEYGAISVVVQYYCDVELVTKVPKDVFVPAPKVESAVLHLSIRKNPPVELLDETLFFRLVKAAFGQRRKTLLNSVSALLPIAKEQLQKCLQEADIEGSRRAETLDLQEFAKLANIIANSNKR